MTEHIAQNDMHAATVFGAKTAIISDLPSTALDTLSTPSTLARGNEAMLARLEAGERPGRTQTGQMFEKWKRDTRTVRI